MRMSRYVFTKRLTERGVPNILANRFMSVTSHCRNFNRSG